MGLEVEHDAVLAVRENADEFARAPSEFGNAFERELAGNIFVAFVSYQKAVQCTAVALSPQFGVIGTGIRIRAVDFERRVYE